MKRIHYLMMFVLLLSACSKEDELTPTGAQDDYFTVPSGATAEDAELRRSFHQETGVHLLFTDTIRHEQRGFYADGTPRWYTETIDLGYSLTGNSGGRWQLTQLHDLQDKKTAARVVEEYILPHLGQAVRPYSFLLVDNLEQWNSRNQEWRTITFYNSYRCLAINTGSLLDSDDKEASSLQILKSMLNSKLENADATVLKPFKSLAQKYYDAYWGYAEFYEDFEDQQSQYYELDDAVYYAKGDYYDAEDAYNAAEEAFDNGEISEEELAAYEATLLQAEEELNRLQDKYDEFMADYRPYLKRIANECGFIWFNNYGSIRMEEYDMTDYVSAIFNTEEDEFMETYREYPLVREKYTVLKKIIQDMGFVF